MEAPEGKVVRVQYGKITDCIRRTYEDKEAAVVRAVVKGHIDPKDIEILLDISQPAVIN